MLLSVLTLHSELLTLNCFAGAGADAADFLRVPPDSASASLGNTGAANADSDFAAYHNPALLGRTDARLRAAVGQTQWLDGVRAAHAAVSLARRTPGGPAWGMGLFLSDWGSGAFEATDTQGRSAGSAEYRARNLGLAVSRSLAFGLDVGAAVKQVRQSFSETAGGGAVAAATAWDLGASLSLARVTAGLSAQNLGGDLVSDGVKERLPSTLRAGLITRSSDGRLALSLEASQSRAKPLSWRGGASFSPFSSFSLRAGYDALVGRTGYVGLTSGVGFQFKDVSLDYSFAPFGDLGGVQRISMSWKMGKAETVSEGQAKDIGADGLWPDMYRKRNHGR